MTPTYRITFKPLLLAFETLHNKAFHIPFNIYLQVLYCVGSKPSYCSSDKMWALANPFLLLFLYIRGIQCCEEI